MTLTDAEILSFGWVSLVLLSWRTPFGPWFAIGSASVTVGIVALALLLRSI